MTRSGDPDIYTQIRFGGGAAGTFMLLPNLGASIGADLIIFPDEKTSGTTVDNTSYYVIDFLLGLSMYL